MDKELSASEHTIRNVVRKDLKTKLRARIKKHLVYPSVKEKRFERSNKLLSLLKKSPTTILFSDEKLFTVESVSNSRTNRFIIHQPVQAVPEHVKYTFKTKHPASVMMFGLISSDGLKMPPVFIKSGQKVNTNEYIRILENHVKLWIDAHYFPDDKVVFQ